MCILFKATHIQIHRHAHRFKCALSYSTRKTHTPLQTILVVDGGLKPIDGKGDNAGKDGGSAVDQGNHDGLALKVVVVLVVAGKSYE